MMAKKFKNDILPVITGSAHTNFYLWLIFNNLLVTLAGNEPQTSLSKTSETKSTVNPAIGVIFVWASKFVGYESEISENAWISTLYWVAGFSFSNKMFCFSAEILCSWTRLLLRLFVTFRIKWSALGTSSHRIIIFVSVDSGTLCLSCLMNPSFVITFGIL